MIAEGMPNKQIAHKLGISEHTVKFHVSALLGKLGAGSRAEAVGAGIRQGVIML
jgi:DNA-binding NarL/FixJ family response regulator